MSKRFLFYLILGCALALTACEKRDVDAGSGADEESEADGSADQKSDVESDEKTDGEKPEADEDAAGDDGDSPSAAEKSESSPSTATTGYPTWESCGDGAREVLHCKFDGGGGATLCSAEDFVELRLARAGSGQSVHRHRGGERKSVEMCVYSSPHRNDHSLTFYERGQRLMVESHYVNPESGYAEGATGETDWSVTIAPEDGEKQTWRCKEAKSEGLGALDDSTAIALRSGTGDTCATVREPTIASNRRGKHQLRDQKAVTCGAEAAPESFVEQAAAGPAGGAVYTAEQELSADEVQYTGVRLSSQPEGSAVSGIASCTDFFERVRAETEARTVGSPPYQVAVDFGLLRYDGHRIFDAASDVCVDFCDRDSAVDGDFIETSFRGLSLVGPVFSYARTDTETANSGPTYHHASWGAIDLRTMQPASIDTLIDTESALTALQNDTYIRRNETLSKAVADADSFQAALAAMREQLDGVKGYAFHYYNPRKKIVALRIPFTEEGPGEEPYSLSQIGIWVKPRAEWIPAFEKARNAPDGGFFMTNYELTF